MKNEDMLHLSRPLSRHPKMRREDRAKIFAPFAALQGYDKAIEGKERILVPQICLSEETKELLDQQFQQLRPGDSVTVTFFSAEDVSGDAPLGRYTTVTGMVKKVDTLYGTLFLENTQIPITDIAALTLLSASSGPLEEDV